MKKRVGGGGGITTSRSKFLSHATEKFCWGIRKFRVSKSFLHEKGIFCVENFLSHTTEKLREWSLLIHKNSGIEKIYG